MVSVSTTSTAVHQRAATRSRGLAVLSDYFLLTKPRVSAMVVLTAAGGYYLGCLRSGISPFQLGLVEAVFGIALVTAGSSALNQAYERATDRRMPRTAQRPMAQHRIGLAAGLITGFLLVFVGSLYLAFTTNLLTGTLTLLTAVLYVGIYTPLKRITRFNTFIGAIPGALPPLIGWTAARGLIEWPAIALFAILFVWQFPHFMAIGWLYRNDYASAGLRVTATQQPAAKAARASVMQALVYAILMIPISLWPTYLHVTGWPYAVAASALGLWYLYATIRFSRITRSPEDEATNRPLARNLLKVSVMYLPLLLLAMALNAQGRLFF
jgi:protoheme IX farnesyltransferase